ncbi:FAS1 domain-containing protein [Gilbertella persicaria]|uniref:FAS1 domain-containing protein n=1 Tax=Gilbertella persicaria TaxID=101096 RepID=UPI00221EA22C|nr:FAS1 domain-containing protein [Gilbertella persicaria]KAI8070632.1 FAS1 domain-containing protein [Gilbertella persicaria]
MQLLKVISLTLLGVSFASAQNSSAPLGDNSKTLTQLLTTPNNNFGVDKFVALLTSDPGYAPIIQLLNSTDNNFTAFIPNDRAITRLSSMYKSYARKQNMTVHGDYPPANFSISNITAADIVTYHVANGSYQLSNFTWNANAIPSLLNNSELDPLGNGLPLLVTSNVTAERIANSSWFNYNRQYLKYQVGNGLKGANVRVKDVGASNGWANVIDSVLMPPGKPSTVLSNDSDTKILFNLVKQHPDLVNTLNNGSNFTLLAPNNNALRGVDFKSLSNDTIKSIILTHVIPGIYYSSNISLAAAQNNGNISVSTLNNYTLPISVNGSRILINDTARVVDPNVLFNNGVMHVINKLLMPPSA